MLNLLPLPLAPSKLPSPGYGVTLNMLKMLKPKAAKNLFAKHPLNIP